MFGCRSCAATRISCENRSAARSIRYVPSLADRPLDLWTGPRPSTPDSLPVLGTIKRHPGVVLATGHGQSGLALAAITAKLVGALVRGEPAEVDMAPYRVDRFGDAAASSGNSIEEQRDDHR